MMNDTLQTYIRENIAVGFSREDIIRTLLNVGWKQKDIAAAFKIASMQQNTNAIVQTPVYQTQRIIKYPSISLQTLPGLLLRIGLAFVFTFAAVSLSLNPADGKQYLPRFVAEIIPYKVFLTSFGIYEIVLSIWLLSGKRKEYSGFVAAITIFMITIFNIQSFSILFRNVAILFAGLSSGFIGIIDKRRSS